MRKGAATIVALMAVLALPASASAARYTVFAGNPGKTPSSAPASTSLNRFFPDRLRIRQGDRVTYVNGTFHTVSILAAGASRPPLAVPQPGATYSGINDPTGKPFFFNGMQKFIYNPAVFLPVGSTTVNNRKTHSSGAFGPTGSAPARYTLRFTRPGTYRVLCLLHPGMKQTVRVLRRGARETQARVRSAITRQASRGYRDATAAAAQQPPAGTVWAGHERRNAALLAFLPNKLTVSAGTTVTFVNNSPSEVHNMVFGPMAFVEQFEKTTDLLPMSPTSPNQVTPGYIYGSEPATNGALTYTGANYGNGFMWTPLMDDQPGNPPNGLPGTQRITFTTPGTYHYFCGIHGPDMSGDIIVK
jgi:plastocyanin